MGLLDRRVVLVTGKGGVGKTTVAAALAVEAASRGKRVLLAETQGASRVAELFGRHHSGYEVRPLGPDLYSLSLTGEAAIEDYIVQQVKVRAIYKMVFRNRVMGPFMDGVPGVHDLVQLGKIMDLEGETSFGRPVWDLIVVDAPATGHGVTMLDGPRAMMDLTVAGPFHEGAKQIHDLFVDPLRTCIVLVTLPEEMPINETLELHERLGAYQEQVQAVVLNEVHEPPFASSLDAWSVARPHLAHLGEAVELTDRAVRRARNQQRARQRLAALQCPISELPMLSTRRLRVPQLEELGRRLG
ncbi:MAG TPA: ArsA family ATPase [Myxococcota bacterium]|nr:ArsA family ATPase [Myxococcota bacterium]